MQSSSWRAGAGVEEAPGVTAAALVDTAGAAHVACFRLAAGASTGRHTNVTDVVLLVVDGRGWAAGEDGGRQPLATGAMVRWTAGEPHDVGAGGEGLVALLVEAVGITERGGEDHPRNG